jgi:hypothetical protein
MMLFEPHGMTRYVQLAALTFLLAVAPRPIASERLTMVVSPNKSMAPATIRVRLGVEPASENRILDVVADSGDFYRSSEIPLDGEHAPHTIVVEFPSLPAGAYTVRGMIRDSGGHRCASVDQEVTVLPSIRDR